MQTKLLITRDDAPIEIKEGLNIPAGKPIQAGGVPGSAGQVLSSTGATIQWITPFDGDYNSLTNTPTIPAAQVPETGMLLVVLQEF